MRLEKIGLHRPELRAWAMYDWAISGLQVVIMVAVFPIFFVKVAGSNLSETAAVQQLARANTIAMVIVAIMSPFLGAIADYSAAKKRLLAVFTGIGVVASVAMFGIGEGELRLASTLFIVALIGGTGCMVFYEALLPHIARSDEVDRVSTAGYGLGYLGGGLLLALNLFWILKPEWFGLSSEGSLPARLSFVSVGIWWLMFCVPLFRRVPEPPRAIESDETPRANPARVAVQRIGETVRELRGYKQAFLMLVAFLIYNDGIQTIIKMATAYGTEIGIEESALITAVLLVQFVGIPFAFMFGHLAGRIGAKPAIFFGLLVYVGISILGYFMKTAAHFYVLAALVGMVQGGTQALSRSLFASMIPPHKSGEFFGFYSVFEKFAGILGPLLFDIMIATSGSSRNAILSVIVFFVVGAALLWRVDVKQGQRVARERELDVKPLSA
jgi:MFS transporter, UMF1 family